VACAARRGVSVGNSGETTFRAQRRGCCRLLGKDRKERRNRRLAICAGCRCYTEFAADGGAAAADEVDWLYWRDSARELAARHPVIARDAGSASDELVSGARLKAKRNLRSALDAVRKDHALLLERLAAEIRRRKYSIRTEQAYETRVCRFILFCGNQDPREVGEDRVVAPRCVGAQVAECTKGMDLAICVPERQATVDPRSGKTRCHHMHEDGLQKAVKAAAQKAGITKKVNSSPGMRMSTNGPWVSRNGMPTISTSPITRAMVASSEDLQRQPWLIAAARRVDGNAKEYGAQLQGCRARTEKGAGWW